MGSELPYRIDLLDEEIDSLRSFDPETQRGIESVKRINLLPGKELPLDEDGITLFRRNWHERFNVDHRKCPIYQDVSDGIAPAGIEYYLPLFFEQTGTLFDYLPANSWLLSSAGIEGAAEHYWQDIQQRYEQRIGDIRRPVLPPATVFQTVPEIFSRLKDYPRVTISEATLPDSAGSYNFAIDSSPPLNIDSKQDDPIAALREYCRDRRVLFCAESAGRREALIDLLTRHKLKPKPVSGWREFTTGSDSINITVAPLDEGISGSATKPFALIAESQLFGKRVSQSRRRKKASNTAENVVKNLAELRVGAPVVHADHGVGRYLGLQTLNIDNQANEFLSLEYADGAKLYVPVTSLQLISRYSGADDELAPLHRLGTDQWSKAKRKAAEKIRDVAAELLDIYARREACQGRSFELSDEDYYEFANAFPFEETPDQQTAIEAVIADLKSIKPMDRLVCGDVGFGKTEVAVRAAFVAVQNNTQVAILIPTTLLGPAAL